MKRIILTLILIFIPIMVISSTGDGYPLDKVDTDHTDKASLQRGLKYYQNYCSGCHSTGFQRYERVADDLGIPHDLMMNNLVFTKDTKIGDLMTNNMNPKDAKKWFGIAPPDLTLVARVRGEDWLYTFLRTFYEDPTRPWGVNNKVFPDVAMPYVLMDLQGVQIDTCEGIDDSNEKDPLTGEKLCGLKVDSERKGSMTPTEFDQAIYDLVNFLSYSAEPMKMERQRLGVYVLLFLLVFFVFAYFLKREYWKDIH